MPIEHLLVVNSHAAKYVFAVATLTGVGSARGVGAAHTEERKTQRATENLKRPIDSEGKLDYRAILYELH